MYSALGPVAGAVYAVLQPLNAFVAGGIWDDVPQQNLQFPCVAFEVGAREQRGLGTGSLPEVELRTHVYSQYGGMMEAREIDRLIIGVLRDQALPLDPALYRTCGLVFWDSSTPLPDVELNGIKVHELVSIFRIYVEEPSL
jgi:hypothetical protein